MSAAPIEDQEQIEIPEVLPLLPIRDLVVFPYMIVPLYVSREISSAAIDEALAGDRLVFLASQKDMADDDPPAEGLYTVGTVGMVMRTRKLPDGRVKVLVQGLIKARAVEFLRDKPGFRVRLSKMSESAGAGVSLEAEALMRSAKERLERLVQMGKALSPDVMLVVSGIADPGRLADLVAANLGLKVSDAQAVLEEQDPSARLKRVEEHLRKEVAVQTMQHKIQSQAREEMSKTQREYYLREQLRQIQNELGESDGKGEEILELREKLKKAELPSEAEVEAQKQLRRLDQMHQDAAEAAVLRTYLDWVIELPWSKLSEDALDLARAKAILDEDHYGLQKIKERIIEYLGVRKLKKDMKGPILCFAGPPGVGKTSLGRSIARALGRNFVRVSLGGVRDEAEIRGHRRTYVGAMPGRIIQGLKSAGTRNPVLMLDEMDKLGADFRGDPSAALLEVLDPEQNHTFRDHYLNLPFDLSRVLFIATANLIDPIPPPLRDRMEVLQLSGYTEEEKRRIARRHIVPKQLFENGIDPRHLLLKDSAVRRIIREYTREAGLRNMERMVAAVARKVARRVAEGSIERALVGAKAIPKYLGPPRFLSEPEMEANTVGQANGLAWTPAGGEVLHVEVSSMRGKGGLILTGQLGEVMKESAQAALTFMRSRAPELGIDEDYFQSHELHLHVPAGAIPKDGPSAGVCMATAMISLVTGVAVRRDVAMTGEMTLRGRVLPIGGLKEKVLAAMRVGIHTVVIPEGNRKDLEEIPGAIRKKVRIVPATRLDQVLEVALEGGLRSLPASRP